MSKPRPLRALALLLSSWIGFRAVAMTSPGDIMVFEPVSGSAFTTPSRAIMSKPVPMTPRVTARTVAPSTPAPWFGPMTYPFYVGGSPGPLPEGMAFILPSQPISPPVPKGAFPHRLAMRAHAPEGAMPSANEWALTPRFWTLPQAPQAPSASDPGHYPFTDPVVNGGELSLPFMPGKRQPKLVLSLPDAPPPSGILQNPRGWYMQGSSWFIERRASAQQAIAPVGQLGGSQAGGRLFVSRGRLPLAFTTLSTTPLGAQGGQFLTAGVALRGRTVGLIAERRFSLDGLTRGATALTAYGGLYNVRLPARLKLEAYAQTGLVETNPFADGAVHIAHPLGHFGPLELSGGAALWGGAQTRLNRLDIGPELWARVPIRRGTLRVSAEWRHRIGGNAEPGSGPALTAGFDF
jgi:hypothetical protein